MNLKSGYQFRIQRPAFAPGTREVLEFWAVVALVVFLLWCIAQIPVPGPTSPGYEGRETENARLLAIQQEELDTRAVRASDELGATVTSEDLTPAQQPRP